MHDRAGEVVDHELGDRINLFLSVTGVESNGVVLDAS